MSTAIAIRVGGRGLLIDVQIMTHSDPPGIRRVTLLDRDHHLLWGSTLASPTWEVEGCPLDFNFVVTDIPVYMFPLFVLVTQCSEPNAPEPQPEELGPLLQREEPTLPGAMPCDPSLSLPPTPQCLTANAEADGARALATTACDVVHRLRDEIDSQTALVIALWIAFALLCAAAIVAAAFGLVPLAGVILFFAAVAVAVAIGTSRGIIALRRRLADAIHELELAQQHFNDLANRVRLVCCPEHRTANLSPISCP